MAKQLIAELAGTGKIFRGNQLLTEVPYSLRIYQEYVHGIPALRDIEGSVHADQRFIFPLIGEELSLELNDGHRIGFFFTDAQGLIANTTGILSPQGQEIA
jgi:glucan phosphorylase